MKLSNLQIQIRDHVGCIKMIPWRGHIVGGTEKTFAVTRVPEWEGNNVKPSKSLWTISHLPTGRTVHRLADKKLATVLTRARRMHKIFAKHGVAHSTDLEVIKAKVSEPFHKAFK